MIPGEEVDIVVPILNEASCVRELIQRLRSACPGARLIFVDNGSTDGTLDQLQASGVDVIRHSTNEGYGKSLRDGIDAGTRPNILTIDADLEYPPECAPQLLSALETSGVVYGSRFLDGNPDMTMVRRSGNRWLTSLFNAVCSQQLTDLYTGVKAFRRDAVADGPFEEAGFAFVVEFAVRAARAGRIADVAVAYHPRVKGRSKMRHVAEGIRALRALAKYRLNRS
ncbi:MAG: glycosyltransferase family 2 protein [Acidobacteriota bacterium]